MARGCRAQRHQSPFGRLTRREVKALGRTAIFYYHSVGGPPPQTLALDTFRQHLQCIRRHGLDPVTVTELVTETGRTGRVALAFDDGLIDNYTNVLPLLLEFGFRATFFVVPGYDRVTRFVHPGSGRWSDEPRAGYSVPFHSMQAAHRRELVACGMEVGSHSQTHRALTRIPPGDLVADISGSKKFLEDELGVGVNSFCYPKGRFNRVVMREVRAAGYRSACTTLPGYFRRGWNPYRLHRFLVEDPVYFEAVLTGKAFSAGPLARLAGKSVGQALASTRSPRTWSDAP